MTKKNRRQILAPSVFKIPTSRGGTKFDPLKSWANVRLHWNEYDSFKIMNFNYVDACKADSEVQSHS